MAKTTSPTVNSGQGALSAGRDTSGRRVPSEPPYTSVEVTPRDTHRLNGDGSSTRR